MSKPAAPKMAPKIVNVTATASIGFGIDIGRAAKAHSFVIEGRHEERMRLKPPNATVRNNNRVYGQYHEWIAINISIAILLCDKVKACQS